MSRVVRIDGALLPWIDAAVNEARDEFDSKKYGSRKDVVDDAVKRLVGELGVKPKEAP
jgi:hypothetical protein